MSAVERGKSPSQSQVEMTQIILPGDANSLGNAFGGRVMQWIDVSAGVASRRHGGGIAVTASIDSLEFHRPIRMGDVVVLHARVNRAWRSSMEVGVRVEYEQDDAAPQHAVSAYLTFVAIDEDGRPRRVPPITPETDEDRRRCAAAEQRRERRLARKLRAQEGQ
jgi:acyl-CoA hydrolase